MVERGLIQRLDHPELGTVSLIGPAHGLTAQKDAHTKAPPLLGEDTQDVLVRVLGLNQTRIDDLTAAGVVLCHTYSVTPASALV